MEIAKAQGIKILREPAQFFVAPFHYGIAVHL
jgi:hypothetical protein